MDLLTRKLQNRPRILITRLSHIGDCVLTLPMLCALRKAYPDAFIAWATERPSNQLLTNHPDLDELIIVPKGWLKSPTEILRLRSALRKLKFDISIDPQSLTKSSALGWLSGASWRIGFGGRNGRELVRFFNNEQVNSRSPHLVDRTLDLLTRLNIEKPEIEFKLPICQSELNAADNFVELKGLQAGFVLINPGCGWESRRWEMDRYAAVARHIGQTHAVRSVVAWAGPTEETMAADIVAASDGHAIAAPKTRLLELAALATRSSFYLGSDTGPAHIAVAVGKPCVGLFGSTRPELSGPYGDTHISVQRYYQSGNSRARRKAGNTAMQAITVEQVCEACDQMIDRLSTSHGASDVRIERRRAA